MQLSAVHTGAAVASAFVIPRSRNSPAATATDPVPVQLCPCVTEHVKDEFVMLPGVPIRIVTVIVAACCEYTDSEVAVHPFGTHASTAVVSDAPWFGLFKA